MSATTSIFEPRLVQARAAQSFQIMRPVGVPLDRQLVRDPVERNIGLCAAKLPQGGGGNVILPSHTRGRRQHPVGADKIAAVADSFS